MALEDDRKVIVSMLQFARDVLEEVVTGHIKDDLELFQSAWLKEVKPELENLIANLSVIPYEADSRWIDLKQHGMTGEQLKLKRARLGSAALSGVLGKILKMLNILLGSIPGAEAAKEFKEYLEEAADDPNAQLNATLG